MMLVCRRNVATVDSWMLTECEWLRWKELES